ncbi:MAG: hypothetical protein JXQ72_03885, partial [Anaerolineae bacterium]|nr:hypothetical protein [Anaerolineae bacterium]
MMKRRTTTITKTTANDPDLPRWLWPVTALGVGIVVLVTAFTALALALGAADPPVAPRIAWTDKSLAWAGESGWYVAPAGADLPPDGNFTLTVRARFGAEAGPGATWGIWIEEPGKSRVMYAISGGQYLTTRRCPASAAFTSPPSPLSTRGEGEQDAKQVPSPYLERGFRGEVILEDCPALRPEWRWFFYPRIRLPGQSNTLTLHREPSGDIRLRINQERMGNAPVALSGHWGVWARDISETGETG